MFLKRRFTLELEILYYIQTLHTPMLNKIFMAITALLGSKGLIVVFFSLVLMAFKKTRRYGLAILLSFSLAAVLGYAFKLIIARPRPFLLSPEIELIIKAPKGYSFPSNHSALAFAAATAVFLENKYYGLIAVLIAALVAFSRLYLFVHFPSDVIAGVALGIGSALIIKKYLLRYFV